MFRPLRTLISLTVLAGMVWFSFAVELGDKTLAEHVDTISATPEAKQLLEGTRETIDPALADVRDRMFGEYVEAPTRIAHDEPVAAPEPALPGRRRARTEAIDDGETPPEPARPGRRLRPNGALRDRTGGRLGTALSGDVRRSEGALRDRTGGRLGTALPARGRPAEWPPSIPLPWPRSASEDRSFLAPILERARSWPPAPEPTPIPIIHPVIDPELPELPGSR